MYLRLEIFTFTVFYTDTINYIKSTDEAVIKLVYIVFWQCKRICFKGHRFSAYHTNCFLFWLTVLELFPNVCSRESVCINNLNYMCSRSRSLPFSHILYFLSKNCVKSWVKQSLRISEESLKIKEFPKLVWL